MPCSNHRDKHRGMKKDLRNQFATTAITDKATKQNHDGELLSPVSNDGFRNRAE